MTSGAEDAVQQTLVTAWRDPPALRDIERFEAWIHRILVHTCYAEAKRASKWSANVVALPLDGPATPDSTQSIVTRDALDRGFRRLPTEQRAAFVLHHYLGWSVGEIAENLGVPTETIRSRLPIQPGGCGVRRSEQAEITIDGQPGRIWEGCPNEIEANVAVGRRLYIFTLFGDADVSTVSRAVFDAYASTIDLRPEEAASPAP